MTFFFTPRMSSSAAATPEELTQYGWYPKTTEPIPIKQWPELKRVRVKKRNELDEPVEIEIDEPPAEITLKAYDSTPALYDMLDLALQQALLRELRDVLSALETAQIEKARLVEIWKRIEEEELALWLIMM